jgi:hypothetical protein
MEIRRAEVEDLPLMAKTGKYFHDISDYGKVISYDEIGIQNSLMGLMNSPMGIILNAWEGDKLLGMIAGVTVPNFYSPSEFAGQCLFVAVVPEEQQKKVSKMLRRAFEDWSMKMGASLFLYAGYSKKFIKAMKAKGYSAVETVLVKKVVEPDAIPV